MKKKFMEINDKYKYKINVEYPLTPYDKINHEIKKMIETISKEFRNSSKRSTQLNMYYTLYITYASYEYNGMTSYVFTISEFTGGAHPNNYLKSIRFNKDGTLITIDNLIGDNSNMLADLCSISRKELLSRKDFKDSNIIKMVLDGTRPIKDNFANFAFTNDGLLIFFDYYQVAPYYYGLQKVLIPYDKLK